MNPFISVAIPTRNRPELARMCVEHLLAQDYDNFEILILDNSDCRDLQPAEWADPRCRLLPTSSVLAMPANWERALSEAAGEYLIVLSDKDMVIPGALSRIADAIRHSKSDVVSFRKAGSFESASLSFVQVCTGNLIEIDFALVAHAWFDRVQHMHDAPMLYNSAVRLDLLRMLGKRAGKFFVGTGPDVASSILLAGAIAGYILIDRPLVVSFYGPWSIGSATTKGRQGAAAKWLAEFGKDPLLEAGVIHGVTGVIAETLIACKKAHPDLLKSYRVAWPAYVRGVMWELDARRQAGVATSDAIRFLAMTNSKPYSLREFLVGVVKYWWDKTEMLTRVQKRWRRLVGSDQKHDEIVTKRWASISLNREDRHDDGCQFTSEAEQYFLSCTPMSCPYRDVPYVHLSTEWTLKDVIALAHTVNEMLDELALDQSVGVSV